MIGVAEMQQSWALLETSAPEAPDVRVRGIGRKVERGEILLGIDISGDRHLLIPVAPGSKIRTDDKSSGVLVGRLKLEEGGAKRTFVDVSCSMSHLFDHFDIIAAEVLHDLNSSSESPDVIAIAVLERWRELLARERGTLPSIDRLIGLFGELNALRQLVHHHAGAVSWWLGPENGRHDFVTPFGAMEVKTTRANDDWAVTIHGLGQLESPANGELLAAVFKIEPHPAGTSIPEIVDEIVASGGERSVLLSKLGSCGIETGSLSVLAPHTFALRESRIYRVADGFPRITADSFAGGRPPSGVRTVQYTIDLSSDPPSFLSESDAASALGLLAGADA
ncbi:MAG: PD-(D/E)XK motif protein [Actinomycetota bacterium]